MMSAEEYDAELAERYGWINRALPAEALGDFVSSLAHRLAGFPGVGQKAVKTGSTRSRSRPYRTFVAIRICSARKWVLPSPRD
jgi:enoyl-CoA hydratase/carnithine racemase